MWVSGEECSRPSMAGTEALRQEHVWRSEERLRRSGKAAVESALGRLGGGDTCSVLPPGWNSAQMPKGSSMGREALLMTLCAPAPCCPPSPAIPFP